MFVQPDHRIAEEGDDKMVLTEHQGGDPIVTAERSGCCGAYKWTIRATNTEDVSVDTRKEAVDGMIDMAFQVLGHNPDWHMPGGGYSTHVPGEWRDGTYFCLRDKP